MSKNKIVKPRNIFPANTMLDSETNNRVIGVIMNEDRNRSDVLRILIKKGLDMYEKQNPECTKR